MAIIIKHRRKSPSYTSFVNAHVSFGCIRLINLFALLIADPLKVQFIVVPEKNAHLFLDGRLREIVECCNNGFSRLTRQCQKYVVGEIEIEQHLNLIAVSEEVFVLMWFCIHFSE